MSDWGFEVFDAAGALIGDHRFSALFATVTGVGDRYGMISVPLLGVSPNGEFMGFRVRPGAFGGWGAVIIGVDEITFDVATNEPYVVHVHRY